MDTKLINIIAAVALNGAIGRNNDLMWHIGEDLKFFKKTTLGHPVIMGRKCFESIGRALPGRRNIVVSRGEPSLPENVLTAHSIEEALDLAGDDCFVIGGGQIYAEAMKYVRENAAQCDCTLYVTRVSCSPDDADVFFPAINDDEWKMIEQGEMLCDESSGLEFRFEKYRKISLPAENRL